MRTYITQYTHLAKHIMSKYRYYQKKCGYPRSLARKLAHIMIEKARAGEYRLSEFM